MRSLLDQSKIRQTQARDAAKGREGKGGGGSVPSALCHPYFSFPQPPQPPGCWPLHSQPSTTYHHQPCYMSFHQIPPPMSHASFPQPPSPSLSPPACHMFFHLLPPSLSFHPGSYHHHQPPTSPSATSPPPPPSAATTHTSFPLPPSPATTTSLPTQGRPSLPQVLPPAFNHHHQPPTRLSISLHQHTDGLHQHQPATRASTSHHHQPPLCPATSHHRQLPLCPATSHHHQRR